MTESGVAPRRTGAERSGRTSGLAGGVLIAAGVALGLVAAELAARGAGFEPRTENVERRLFWVFDPELGWHHRPGQRGVLEMAGFRTEVAISAQGLRDREYAQPKPAGVRRVLVLGDSLGFGFGVEQQESFSERLEAELCGVEVINASVSGYSTDQELLWFEREGWRYEPDLVVLLLTGNDVAMNEMSLVYGLYRKPRFEIDAAGRLLDPRLPVAEPARALRVLEWLRGRLALLELANAQLHAWNAHGRARSLVSGERAAAPEAGSPDAPSADVLTVALLERLRERVRKQEGELLLMVTRRFWTGLDEQFAAFLERLHARALDPLFLDAQPGYREDAFLLEGDPHWNAGGHAFVAERLFERRELRALARDAASCGSPPRGGAVPSGGPSSLQPTGITPS